MEEESIHETVIVSAEVPWTARDAWLGVAGLVAWLGLSAAASVAIEAAGIKLEIGWVISVGEAALLLPVWWLAVRKYKVGWDRLGLRDFREGTLGFGCGMLLLFYLGNFIYTAGLMYFGLQREVDLAPLFRESSSPWLIFFGGIAVAPFVEEIFFRGFLFAGLRERHGWKWAAGISALLFAATHMQLTNVLPIFALGYLFAYLYQRGNSIWPGILLHATVNTIGLGMYYLVTVTGVV